VEIALDLVLLSLPDSEQLAPLKVKAERRQDRVKAENEASKEYLNLKSRLQELENDYPSLKKL
jgi:beta-glucosidase-like glycosyl hydrolase